MLTNNRASVSVIVLTYKQAEVLNLIIQGLSQQTYSGDMEVIVSDDGSPWSVVGKNIATLNRLKCPSKYVWQPDLGYRASVARNNGIRASQNDLLIFLDGDIVPCPELVEKHVEQHIIPNRLVAGNRTWIGEIKQVHNFNQLKQIVPDRIAIARGEKEHLVRLELLNSANPWRACFSANLSIRRNPDVWFDPNFVGWGPEDAEFSYRMCVKHHLTPVYDGSIGSYHLESPDAVGNVFRKNDHESIVNYIRNTFRFFDNCPGLELEEVFYGFPRLCLDRKKNIWTVVPRTKVDNINLREIVDLARDWMQSHQPPN
jgi:glycosyltransferase involved in cell wall biosynthesis